MEGGDDQSQDMFDSELQGWLVTLPTGASLRFVCGETHISKGGPYACYWTESDRRTKLVLEPWRRMQGRCEGKVFDEK